MATPRRVRIVLGCVAALIITSLLSARFHDPSRISAVIPASLRKFQRPGDALEPSSSQDEFKQMEEVELATVKQFTDGPAFEPVQESIEAAKNDTLGFEKIFLVNLPERSDKLDSFTVAASLSGFRFEVINGVKGAEIPDKSLPSLEDLTQGKRHRDSVVGCWRAHMNFARKIVADGLSSALVLEDDADWDIYLKDQMALFAEGSQFVTEMPSATMPHSPYGDDWDLLWLGHCSSAMKHGDSRRFVIQNDRTATPPDHRVNFAGPENLVNMQAEGYDTHTRIVYESRTGICTYAYALSYRGAMKMLRLQNDRKVFTPIDLGLNEMCGNPDKKFRCISVFPQLFDTHRLAGSKAKDSDIDPRLQSEEVAVEEDTDIVAGNSTVKGKGSKAETAGKGPGKKPPPKKEEFRDHASTWNIVHSTRLNLDRMLFQEMPGDRSNARSWSQWPDLTDITGPVNTRTEYRVPENYQPGQDQALFG